MIAGLDLFREHFEEDSDKYILIGGGACDVQFSSRGLPFRATKDLDIVLVIEALDDVFVKKFWDFIKAGEYVIAQKGTRKNFYRFIKPGTVGYPYMIELFSRKPDLFTVQPGFPITDIPTGEDVSSLSAILLDDDYYEYVLANCEMIDGVHVAGNPALICLKAKAFLNNRATKEAGNPIDEKDITKHKNDVIRLSVLLTGNEKTATPEKIKTDIRQYIEIVQAQELDPTPLLKPLGITTLSLNNIIQTINDVYSL